MPANLTLLSEVPLFERLDDSERQLLADQLDEMSFAAGAHIFNRGDPGGSIYIVSSGEVEIYIEDSTGSKIVFETAKRGDFFGELSLLDGDPRSASALAVQETTVLRVDRADLALLFKARPEAAMDILTVMGRRLREADQLLRVRPVSSPNEAVDEQSTWILKLADFVAAFSGTFTFLSLHIVWFALWVFANLGRIPGVKPWDEYPFGFLTMVVSLEAIFLSCLVLISHSRQGAKDKIRSDVEYSANIRAGLEVTQLHVKIDALYDKILARLSTSEKGQATAGGSAPVSTTATNAQAAAPLEAKQR